VDLAVRFRKERVREKCEIKKTLHGGRGKIRAGREKRGARGRQNALHNPRMGTQCRLSGKQKRESEKERGKWGRQCPSPET